MSGLKDDYKNNGPMTQIASKLNSHDKAIRDLRSLSLKDYLARVGTGTTYANNAAAIAGGLKIGDLYRLTGSDHLCIVH
jgi:hypothetical protein